MSATEADKMRTREEKRREENKTLLSSDDDEQASNNKKPAPDYQAIIDLYNTMLPELPSVKLLTDKRRAAIRSCCQLKPSYYSMDFWQAYFSDVKASDFLMGRKTDWRADFDFLTTRSKFVKVIEGAYSK